MPSTTSENRPTLEAIKYTAAGTLSILDQLSLPHETGDGLRIAEAYITAAKQMLIDDVNNNRAIGDYGAKWIINQNPSLPRFKVLTHCNTGSLATAGYGTALGVIRSLHLTGVLEHVFCTETRPYNQGSRLTAYELVSEQIPSTLITDSMASALFKKENGMVGAVIVGADRVARNGDTANKV